MDKNKELALIARRAAKLVRKGWTQGAFARDKSGNTVNWTNPDATCFCARGAMHRAANDLYTENQVSFDIVTMHYTSEFTMHFQRMFNGNGMVTYNDHIAQDGEQVALALDKCAEIFEAREDA